MQYAATGHLTWRYCTIPGFKENYKKNEAPCWRPPAGACEAKTFKDSGSVVLSQKRHQEPLNQAVVPLLHLRVGLGFTISAVKNLLT